MIKAIIFDLDGVIINPLKKMIEFVRCFGLGIPSYEKFIIRHVLGQGHCFHALMPKMSVKVGWNPPGDL